MHVRLGHNTSHLCFSGRRATFAVLAAAGSPPPAVFTAATRPVHVRASHVLHPVVTPSAPWRLPSEIPPLPLGEHTERVGFQTRDHNEDTIRSLSLRTEQ